jgi:hypothetical protein
MNCENRRSDGSVCVPPACSPRAEATHELLIFYHRLDEERDAERLKLCAPCAKVIRLDARRHGYRTTLRRVQ